MAANKHGLGRGLSALFGEESNDVFVGDMSSENKENIKELDILLLSAGSYQPRQSFDDEEIEALCASIKENGILQPLLVRKKGGKYEIIAAFLAY